MKTEFKVGYRVRTNSRAFLKGLIGVIETINGEVAVVSYAEVGRHTLYLTELEMVYSSPEIHVGDTVRITTNFFPLMYLKTAYVVRVDPKSKNMDVQFDSGKTTTFAVNEVQLVTAKEDAMISNEALKEGTLVRIHSFGDGKEGKGVVRGISYKDANNPIYNAYIVEMLVNPWKSEYSSMCVTNACLTVID